MSEEIVKEPLKSRMSFEELCESKFSSMEGRKTVNSKRFEGFLSLPKTGKLRKFVFDLMEKKVAKELNMSGQEIDWSQVDWAVVWAVISKLLPLLILLL